MTLNLPVTALRIVSEVSDMPIAVGDGYVGINQPCGRFIRERWVTRSSFNSNTKLQQIVSQLENSIETQELIFTKFITDDGVSQTGEFICDGFDEVRLGFSIWELSVEFIRQDIFNVDECFIRPTDLSTAYPTFPKSSTYPYEKGSKYFLRTLEYDGVTNRSTFPINSVSANHNFSNTFVTADKEIVDRFLRDRCGLGFEFQSDIYRCLSWEWELKSQNYWLLTAVFEQIHNPFKQSILKTIDDNFDFYDDQQTIIDTITPLLQQCDTWLSGCYMWFSNNIKNDYPFALNSNYISVNAYHTVLGRGGYFPPSAGTTEGQAVVMRAAVHAYNTTNDNNWLTFAINTGNALLNNFYPAPIPTNWQVSDGIRVPHWVINVKESFYSRGAVAPDPLNYGHFDVLINFTNGVGTIPELFLAKVFTVYPTSDRLLWQNVYAKPLNNFEYEIDYWVSDVMRQGIVSRVYPDSESPGGRQPTPTNESVGLIKLKTDFTGTAKVVYSTDDGAIIGVGQLFEPYPMWRELQTDEALGAIDVFPWAGRGFELLFAATGDSKWSNALACNDYTEQVAANVINESAYYKKSDSPNPLAYAGSQVIPVPSTRNITLSRVTSGSFTDWLQADIAAETVEPFPSAEYQNYAVKLKAVSGMQIYAEAACSETTELEVILSLSIDPFDFSQYYKAYWEVGTSPTIRTFELSEFLLWDVTQGWHPYNAQNPIYSYGTTVVTNRVTETINSVPRRVWRITQDLFSFSGAGLVLLDWQVRFPLDVFYKHSGNANWKVTVDGSDYFYTIASQDWGLVTLTADNFGVRSDAVVRAIEIVPTDSNTVDTYLWYVGAAPQEINPPVQTYKAVISSTIATAHTLYIGDFYAIGSPTEVLDYQPAGAVPFTVNVIGDGSGGQEIDAWRGVPSTGYQYPAYYVRRGYWDRLRLVLQFLNDSQVAYRQQSTNKLMGAFMPAYLWEYWDAIELSPSGETNVWSYYFSDPSSNWVGYQVRPLESVCKALYLMKSSHVPPSGYSDLITTATTIVTRYLYYLSSFQVRNDNVAPPTDFYEFVEPTINYEEPHASAFVLRSAIFANLAGINSATTIRLIKACLDYLHSQYVSSGVMLGSFSSGQPTFTHNSVTYNEYFIFWHAEIIEALSLVIDKRDELNYPKCVYFIKP